jgi:hypothetical protein
VLSLLPITVQTVNGQGAGRSPVRVTTHPALRGEAHIYGGVEMCEHEHTVIHTTGSVRFVNGEVLDDVREVILCLDCGEEQEVYDDEDEVHTECPF